MTSQHADIMRKYERITRKNLFILMKEVLNFKSWVCNVSETIVKRFNRTKTIIESGPVIVTIIDNV
jgi:hypothetical protein